MQKLVFILLLSIFPILLQAQQIESSSPSASIGFVGSADDVKTLLRQDLYWDVDNKFLSIRNKKN